VTIWLETRVKVVPFSNLIRVSIPIPLVFLGGVLLVACGKTEQAQKNTQDDPQIVMASQERDRLVSKVEKMKATIDDSDSLESLEMQMKSLKERSSNARDQVSELEFKITKTNQKIKELKK